MSKLGNRTDHNENSLLFPYNSFFQLKFQAKIVEVKCNVIFNAITDYVFSALLRLQTLSSNLNTLPMTDKI